MVRRRRTSRNALSRIAAAAAAATLCLPFPCHSISLNTSCQPHTHNSASAAPASTHPHLRLVRALVLRSSQPPKITIQLVAVGHEADLQKALKVAEGDYPVLAVDWKDPHSAKTLLHFACGLCPPSIKAATLLINAGAEVDETDGVHRTPLNVCASEGTSVHVAIAELLLDSNANPAAEDHYGTSALDVALSKKHDEMATLLQVRGSTQQVLSSTHC